MRSIKVKVLSSLILMLTYSCVDYNVATITIEKEGKIGWKEKERCTITYSIKNEKEVLSALIKNRGGFSSKFYKHSFSIELENKFALCNLPPDDDWIINANYIDKTFMRHKVCYDLFRQMSLKNVASKCAYVNVKLNDKDLGLYVLMEKINAAMIGLDKTDSLAMLFKDPPVFSKHKLSHVKDSNNYFQQKYPKINVSDKANYLTRFKNFMFNSTDEEFNEEIGNWVDIDNVIDWHLMLLFSNNSDGIMKNFFLYKLNSNTPFRFAIWDYDHSFGRDGDNELNMMDRALDCNRSVLLRRLMQTDYSDRLKKRWTELRRLNIISYQNIRNLISENDKYISQEIDKNFTIWPIDEKWYFDNNTYEQEVDLILEFVPIRIDQLDQYFKDL